MLQSHEHSSHTASESVSAFLEHQVCMCWLSDICFARIPKQFAGWALWGEMPEKWFRLSNKFQLCWDNLHFWVELFWSQSMKLLICCVSAQEKQFTISSQIQHGWHWTLAQIQETKPNRSTPRQMRKKDPAGTQHRVLWQVRLLRIIPATDTLQLFNVEHEFHFDVF